MHDTFSHLVKELNNYRNTIILAHYYQKSDIQDTTDFIGDSLVLLGNTMKTNSDVTLFFCAHYRCKTAKFLTSENTLFPYLQMMTVHVMNFLICD